jgi:hypothetical protein
MVKKSLKAECPEGRDLNVGGWDPGSVNRSLAKEDRKKKIFNLVGRPLALGWRAASGSGWAGWIRQLEETNQAVEEANRKLYEFLLGVWRPMLDIFGMMPTMDRKRSPAVWMGRLWLKAWLWWAFKQNNGLKAYFVIVLKLSIFKRFQRKEAKEKEREFKKGTEVEVEKKW